MSPMPGGVGRARTIWCRLPYNSAAVSELIRSPQDRAATVKALVEGVGGRLEPFDYAFGDYDVVAITEVPDNVAMVALSMAVAAGGGLKAFKTTVLIPMP